MLNAFEMPRQPSVPVEGRPAADYTLRPLTLTFADEAIERRFIVENLTRSLPVVRLFLLAAAALYGAFGVLDAYVIPEIRTAAWLIRYAGVCPFMLGILLLTYTPAFPRLAQIALSAAMLSAGFGILGMTALAEAPGNALYYAGLIMVVIYGSSLIRIRLGNAAAISLTLVGLYQLVAIVINPIPHRLLVNNDFFLAMSVATGLFSSYVQELIVRRDFVSNERIRWEKAISDELRIEAESANKSKSDFLAVMSHELRTPLNAILGFTQIMQNRMFGPVGSERYVAYIDDIHKTANHLLSIITDILDLSKAEAGKLTLNEEEVDLVGVLDHCLRLLRERAAEQGLRLSLQAPHAVGLRLRGDERLVKQAFLNLIGNAIKFTPAGGSISVAFASEPDGGWTLRFTDTGIGISEADLPRVLEPFVQVESAFARKHGGTGLGLPLVKKVMELHDGSLEISSTLGAGTTVAVHFPAARISVLPRAAVNVA
jgi:two-component system, cell cycle sensor histidine kinase PleC